MTKPHNCRACGETDPDNFYDHYKSICKECRSKEVIKNTYGKEKERRKKVVEAKKFACIPCNFATYTRQLLDTHCFTSKHLSNEKVEPQSQIDRLQSQLDRLRRKVRIVEV